LKIDRDVPAAEDSGMENLTGRRAQIPGWGRSRWAGLALVFWLLPANGTEQMQWIDDYYDRVYPEDPTRKSPSGNKSFSRLQIWKQRPPVLPAGNN